MIKSKVANQLRTCVSAKLIIEQLRRSGLYWWQGIVSKPVLKARKNTSRLETSLLVIKNSKSKFFEFHIRFPERSIKDLLAFDPWITSLLLREMLGISMYFNTKTFVMTWLTSTKQMLMDALWSKCSSMVMVMVISMVYTQTAFYFIGEFTFWFQSLWSGRNTCRDSFTWMFVYSIK